MLRSGPNAEWQGEAAAERLMSNGKRMFSLAFEQEAAKIERKMVEQRLAASVATSDVGHRQKSTRQVGG